MIKTPVIWDAMALIMTLLLLTKIVSKLHIDFSRQANAQHSNAESTLTKCHHDVSNLNSFECQVYHPRNHGLDNKH